jgi:hypothetical protein
MKRIIVVGYYDRGDRGCSFRDWFDGYQDFLVEVRIRFVDFFGFVFPGKIGYRIHRINDFINGMMSYCLAVDDFFS